MNVFESSADPLNSAFGGAPAVAMLAHDLRGSLQGILGGVILLEDATLAADVRAQIERIGAASRTLDRLLGAMIGEDPEREGRAPPSASVDVPDLLDYLRRRWIGEALERGLSFTLSPGHDLPRTLRVERVALVRVLGNLIGNALKYTGGSSAGHAVQVSVDRAEDGGVTFRVADDGPGMDTAAIEASLRRGPGPAFERAAVHGLGLRIARDLTDRMGGSLALESPAAGGLTATLRFPAALCRAAAVRVSAGRPDLSGLRVLLAEDNPTNQVVAVQMLRALGAQVSVASDGVEALEVFAKDAFDLLVVDIEMPRLSGLDVIRRVRGRGDARAGVPIVALTAYAFREHRERIAAAGASGLISKPITSIDALGRALLAHVGAPAPARLEAAAPEPEAAQPVIDRAVYDALCRSIGSEMMSELLDKVLSDLRANRHALAAARPTLDRGRIRSASHILISVGGAIGAGRLQARAQTLNTLAHRDGDAAIAGELAACFVEIDAALEFTERQRAAG